MPESPDLVIFIMTNDRQTDDRRTEPITLPLAHACGATHTNRALVLAQL